MAGHGVMQNGNPGQRYYNGINFGPEVVNSPEGVLIEMKWQGVEEIRVRITNPPADPASVTITVESYTGESSQQDAGYFVSAAPDKDGKATFRIPNRRSLEIRAIGEQWRSTMPAVFNAQEQAWLLTLVESTSFKVTGTVVDMRTQRTLSGVRVRANSDKEVAYSGPDGKFEILARAGELSPHLIAEHPSYMRSNAKLAAELTEPISLEIGGTSPTGPWRVVMRPLVLFKATIQSADGSSFAGAKSIEVKISDREARVIPVTAKHGAAELLVGDFPWGSTKLTVVVETEDRQKTNFYEVELPPSTWSEQNAYDLRLYATVRN
jgi:hypothetical protein